MGEWARWLLLGGLSVLFGVLALANAVAVTFAVTLVTGSLLIIAGVIQTGFGFRETGTANKSVSIILGLMVAILGISFVNSPTAGARSLTLLITLFIGAAGVLRLIWAFRMRQTRFYWMMLLSAALSILLAAYIFANFEQASAKLLGILLGIELVFNGIALVVLALFLRAYSDDA